MPDDPAAHKRRSEPIPCNTDPRCPGADVRKGDSLTNWDIAHVDRGKVSFWNIPKDDWDRIFNGNTRS